MRRSSDPAYLLRTGTLTLAALAGAGCDQRTREAAPPPSATTAPAAPASSPGSGAPSSSSPAGVVDGGVGAVSSADSPFSGLPSAGTRRSETVNGAGGLYAGLPRGWSTQDVYNAYLLAMGKQARAMVYLVTIDSLEPDNLDGTAGAAAYRNHTKGLTWDGDWTDVTVGPSAYRARMRRGHGVSIDGRDQRRAAVAVGVEVPSRKLVFLLGSWDEPAPEAEAQFADVVRGIGRCVHKPKRGCVAVEPRGEERELPNAPPAVAGPNPFGG